MIRLLALTLFLLSALAAQDSVKDSIVKIYTVSKIPNYSTPWNSNIKRSHGSGTIIDGNRILTNAHVVANETFIEVKRYGQTQRYEAEVEFISHQADLALLKLKDELFFKGTKSLKLGTLPEIRQEIVVYGFPMGGNSLSVSTGIVSRIEHNRYAHSREIFLAIQVDAAVNPGNSGGPAVSDGKIIGVVMQQISKSQNIGYLVPTEIIEHFLNDIKDKKYNGFAHIGIGTQKMENEALRSVYKIPKGVTGVMVMDISKKSSAFNVLYEDDILLSIDGHKIENDGTVEFLEQQFTSYKYYIDKKYLGESVTFGVLRDAKIIKLKVKLTNVADDNLLVNTLEHDVMPRYFIYDGYVFTPLSRNLIIGSRSSLLKLREAASQWATDDREEVVILLKVLADKTNRGDHNFALWIVDMVNSQKFKDFDEFKSIIKDFKGKYLILENKDGVKIAIDRDKALKVHKSILQRYSISSLQNE